MISTQTITHTYTHTRVSDLTVRCLDVRRFGRGRSQNPCQAPVTPADWTSEHLDHGARGHRTTLQQHHVTMATAAAAAAP